VTWVWNWDDFYKILHIATFVLLIIILFLVRKEGR